MESSAAHAVKGSLEKYVFISALKTRKNQHHDLHLARTTIAIGYTIIHKMDSLICSNNANDYATIKACLREQVGHAHHALKSHQSVLTRWFGQTRLPCDFEKCIQQAWLKLNAAEKLGKVQQSRK